MKSIDIIQLVLPWLRYQRPRYYYLCTECKYPYKHRADILASNGKYILEYEVKTSAQDLRLDSSKKKHLVYNKKGYRGQRPNYFFYVVTIDLLELAEKIVPKYYGIIVVDTHILNGPILVARKARRLHASKIDEYTKLRMVRRMSSQLVTLYTEKVGSK